ncbi:unnamed protein product [Symbiodinium sp. CCMP2592]|nr:unnamed protein product [Symbiodinium sp. CCMP2592]
MPPMAAMAMPIPAASLPPVLASPAEVKAASSAWTPQLERGHRSRHGGAKMAGAATFLIGGVAASASRRRLRQSAKSKHCKVVVAVGSTIETLEKDELTDEELQSLFDAASEGKDVVTFDQAASLEGVDAVLEEGAANVEELKVIWGDPDEPLDFEGFSRWYNDVLKLYDSFLWQDAVAPPSDVFDDEEQGLEDMNNLDDEQLLEDAPAVGVQVEQLSTSALKPKQKMMYGTLTDKVPEYQKPPWKLAEEIITGKTDDYLEDYSVEDEGAGRSTEGMATPSAGGGRQNVEITQLFRQACDEKNLLSFDALKEISEFEDMLEQEDISEEELEEIWDELPKKNGDFIDVLAFRDLLAKVDELFEYVEEDEEEDPEEQALMQVEGKGGISKAKKRGLQTVKQDLLDAIARLEAQTDKPAGLGSTEEKDGEVVKLAGELEDVWRDQVGDLNKFDGAKFEGTWELIYSTSVKFRRWGSVLNGVREIKNGEFEALVQKFSPGDDSKYESFNEYDMEEVFKAPNEDGEEVELCMRGQGSWRLGIQQNVVTGEEDVVMKLEITNVEYDTLEDTVEYCGDKTLMSPMCRTFSYGFLSYMDDEYRVMRTSLTGKSLYIFQRIKDEDPYQHAEALRPGGRLLVHDFMVNDSLDGPALGALWGLQHVTVNAQGLGLCPAEVIRRMAQAGFEENKCQTHEMIHGMTKLIVAHKDDGGYGQFSGDGLGEASVAELQAEIKRLRKMLRPELRHTTTVAPPVALAGATVQGSIAEEMVLVLVISLMVMLWTVPLLRPFRYCCETRLHKVYPIITVVNLLLLAVTLHALKSITFNDVFFALVNGFEDAVEKTEQILVGVAALVAIAVVWKFKDRVFEVLGVENAASVFGDFRDWATCWSMKRFHPVELFIWKVEGLPSARLHSLNDVFCEVSLGYNMTMKTRVHHRAGHSCVFKETLQLNFDPYDSEHRLTLSIKSQEVVGAAEIVQLQLGADKVRQLEEPASKDLGSGRPIGWGSKADTAVWAQENFKCMDLVRSLSCR